MYLVIHIIIISFSIDAVQFRIVVEVNHADTPFFLQFQHSSDHGAILCAILVASGIEDHGAVPGFLCIPDDKFLGAGNGFCIKVRLIKALADLAQFFLRCCIVGGKLRPVEMTRAPPALASSGKISGAGLVQTNLYCPASHKKQECCSTRKGLFSLLNNSTVVLFIHQIAHKLFRNIIIGPISKQRTV